MNDLKRRITELKNQLANLLPNINLPAKQQRLLELEDKMQEEGFWNDNEYAQRITQEHSNLKTSFDFWNTLQNDIQELEKLIDQNQDESEETIGFLQEQLQQLETSYQKNRFLLLMSHKHDELNAIVSIHAGAGGVDAQDWAEILLRMYLRYADARGLKATVIDQSRGEQGGIKSATVEINGPYAYGMFKSEAGVHRLVRQSPFNQAHTRETSFALLEIIPVLTNDRVITLNQEDLKIEATTSSGHGGQSVNTTYSAIRITHIPTGIKVSIQNERSQHQNKELALKILSGKLQLLEEERQEAQRKELRGEFKSAEWGNQIRSYVLHPYKLVKDHRTDYEETDPDKVLDGHIDEFVEKYLEKRLSGL